MRRTATAAQERKVLLGLRNCLVSIKVFEIGLRDATKTFLQPSPTPLTNFQSLARLQLAFQGIGSSVHFFSHGG
jgi:hypothetical protein